MTDRKVHFESIEITRVPGFEHGEGFAITDLSPGVNIVHGPNGSGKSTSAKVIHELLWPGHTDYVRPTVAGHFKQGDREWTIRIDAGYVEANCDGNTGVLPEVGPPEHRHRYHLALHELVQGRNADFAKAIADASQGGYDLEATATALKFSDRPAAPRKQMNALKSAVEAVNSATKQQHQLQQSNEKLADLKKRHGEAITAGENLQLLGKIQAYRKATEDCRLIEDQLATFPEGVAQLRGNEREVLEEFALQQSKLESDLADARATCDRATQELASANLPDGAIDQSLFATIRAAQRRLAEVEINQRAQQKELAAADTLAKQAKARLGEHLSAEQLASLETVAIEDVSTFARQADRVRAKRAVLDEQRRAIEHHTPEEIQGVTKKQIQEGVTALRRWLAAVPPAANDSVPNPSKRSWASVFVALGIITGLSIALAVLHHWAWLFAIAAAVGIVFWEQQLRQPAIQAPTEPMADARVIHQDSYRSTGLVPPADWESPTVSDHIHHLIELAERRHEEDQREHRLAELQHREDALQTEQESLDTQRSALEQQLGVQITLADEWLPTLVGNLCSWQRNHDVVETASGTLADLQREQQSLLEQLNTTLQLYGYSSITSADVAVQFIDDLTQRQNSFERANTKLVDGRKRITDSIEPAINDIDSKRRELFHRLELEDTQLATLDAWFEARPQYLQLNKDLDVAKAICSSHRQALADHPHLLELDAVEIEQRIDEERSRAEQRDGLMEEMARIRSEGDAAKAGHALSDALEARDDAEAALIDARDANSSAAVGALLTKWVRTVAVEQSRPQVFRRANELLVRFTRGMLQLELDDHTTPPEFRARRGTEPPRPVTELSVGERVQLLMAVRVAFLEHDESARLPLLLDEALGTSDDSRAGVIIDTVIEIARDTRQVFYFTAQHDEVGKWVKRLEAADMAHKVIDLSQVRQLSAAATTPLQIAAVDVPPPPAPESMGHAAYGERLGVPNINPAIDKLDNLHLWHLIEDVHLLHELLCHQINTWGQLETLLKHGGGKLVNADDAQFASVAAGAKAIRAACGAWRIGRGKPVDREALLCSDLITDTFISDVTALAMKCDGHAEAFLNGLTNGEVKRFRADRIEQLREHFQSTGHIDDAVMLSLADIRIRVLAEVSEPLRTGLLTTDWIDRMLSKLPSTGDEQHAE